MKNKTTLTRSYPWGINILRGSRVLRSDGKVTSLSRLAQTADTFFSVPASIRANGKTISGYVTTEEHKGQMVYCFRHHAIHAEQMPSWPERYSPEFDVLMEKAFSE